MARVPVKTRKTLLFVAESVTLAQVVRLVALGQALDGRFDVHFATSHFDPLIFDGMNFVQHELLSLPKRQLVRAMERGQRLFEFADLRRYFDFDLELLKRVQPDLVVGDFRLSLSTAAEVHGVHCGTLINAYWSRYVAEPRFPVPDHPIVSVVGERLARTFFPMALPFAFNRFCAPLNQLRSKLGLSRLRGMQAALTHGDSTLYADHPQLVPLRGPPASHVFLGPILWSPDVALPAPLGSGRPARPLVYVTLGSSGRMSAASAIVEALSELDVDVVLATAGRSAPEELPSNVHCTDFVAGDRVAAEASVVVCNGGSTTGYQALSVGTPVLAVPSNLDQFLATRAMVEAGAALEVPARSITEGKVRDALNRLLTDRAFSAAAARVQGWFSELDSGTRFMSWALRASA